MFIGLVNQRILIAFAALIVLLVFGLLVARFGIERANYRDELVRKRYSSDYPSRQ
jgi:hypothetical protein